MRLSVLICGITKRLASLKALIDELTTQSLAIHDTIEVLAIVDNNSLIIGDKRNRLVRIAGGDYVVFIDDDDWIAEDYLYQIIRLIDAGQPDVVTFPVEVTLDGGPPKPCYYAIGYPDQGEDDKSYWRWPNHLCVIRRDLVLQHPYPPIAFGEDTAFATGIRPHLKTELAFTHHPLYYYRFSTQHSAVIKP